MKRATLRDLAKILNISTSTVSRALSDHPDISDATKKRVKLVAQELNYSQNIHAKLFRNQRSNLIALILPEINMFYSPQVINGINKTLSNTPYTLITFISNDSYAREVEIIKQCMHWAVEGILISFSKETKSTEHLDKLTALEIKTVILDKSLGVDRFHSATIDNEEAAFQATTKLLEKGHEKIVGIFDNPDLYITKLRELGFKKAYRAIGVDEENAFVINALNKGSLQNNLHSMLKVNSEISAIFTMSDELLSYTVYTLQTLGLSIPDDISLISISDGAFPYQCYPNISHVLDSGYNMGEIACRFLLDLINGENVKRHQIAPTSYMELDSVCTLK